MDLDDIKALIETMAASDLTEMTVSRDGWTLRLVRGAGHAPASQPIREFQPSNPKPAEQVGSETDASDLLAPLAGIVHLRPSPDEPPFVQAGKAVRAGDTLCLLEAMKAFNALRAERDGTVEAVLVTSGSEVEAGQILMRVV
jgi:acetyl-CoA carboxylase biotin carboxyl carrier protein